MMYIPGCLVFFGSLICVNACSKALQAFLDAEAEIEDSNEAGTPAQIMVPETTAFQESMDATTTYFPEVKITVPDTIPPVFTIHTRNMKGSTLGIVHFLCKASGDPLPVFTWKKNGRAVHARPGKTYVDDIPDGSLLRIEGLKMRDQGTYTCVASNGVGTVESSSTLQVNDHGSLPYGFPEVTQHPNLKAVEEGRRAVMSCSASGDPKPGIRWMFNFVPLNMTDPRISLLHSGSLQILEAQESDEGTYECVAENHIGVEYSNAARLYVRPRRRPLAA